VLARSALHHSLVYRSVVVIGDARLVEDSAEKLRALGALLDHIAPGRAADCRPPNERELAATAVLALDLVEVSAKVRTGGPVDDPEDCALPHWAGVVPLRVTAGISGVLVDLPHQVGEHVAPGITLAKVVQPDQLKASLKIAETQARDIQIGQPASIDTHNGVIPGRVQRIDPAVQNGTVTVDVELTGPLPQGARPDLSVDGTIDLERMADVLYVGRPALGNENSTLSLFKIDPGGKGATRVPVKVGRASVNNIQVLEGLKEGDNVILSDMSRWDNVDRIRLE